MSKLTKKVIRDGLTDGRTDPNYRKATLLKRSKISVKLINKAKWVASGKH